MKRRRLSILFVFGLCFCLFGHCLDSDAQAFKGEKIVEISGVVLSSDSAHAVANAVITVLHQNRGVLTNDKGIYSLVCRPGDTLLFSSVGYQDSRFVLPIDYQKRYYNRVQLMQQDTFYLPETVVHALPSGEAFVYAFKYWPIILTPEDRALQRFSKQQIGILRATLPMNGVENQAYYQQQGFINTQYEGLRREGVGLLSPLKWQEFFQAWKRGDFRKKY